MLLDLLIDASLPDRDTRLARLLRGIDRMMAAMAEIDAREEFGRQAARSAPRIEQDRFRWNQAQSQRGG